MNDDLITYFGMAALVVVVLGFIFYVRWRTLRRLQDLMNANATKDLAAQHLIDRAASGSEGMAATTIRPEITLFDDLGQLESAVQAREAFVGKAVASLRKSLAIDAAIALGYASLPWLVDLLRSSASTDGAWMGVGFGALYLVLAALRYMLFRTQFRAIDERPRAERIVMFIVNLLLFFVPTNVHVMTLLEWLLAPRVQAVFMAAWISAMVYMGFVGTPPVPGLAVAALLHAGLIVWRLLDMQHEAGKRLVVLRVFGIEKNAEFLFDGVLGFWKHFGHFFTIVDPAHWRHSHGLASGGTLLVLGLAIMAAFIGYALHTAMGLSDSAAPLAAALFSLPLLAAYARWSDRHVNQSFIRSREHLDSLLAPLQTRPRHLDMTYKCIETRCYNDTWQLTVAEFASGCDAVVMDLRGYKPPRLGCTIEVDFLLDTVPVERIVFVSDSESDPQAAAQLILDAWKELRASSPNLANPSPSVRIYVANRRDHRDIQGVIDLLISAASAQAAPLAARPAPGRAMASAAPVNAA